MPKTKNLPKDLKVEIAHIREEIPLFGGVLPNTDRVLVAKGGGKGLGIYEELETDAHVRTVLAKRKRAVISREWFVNEADDSQEAKAAAELVRKHIKKISFDRTTEGFLDAVLKGFSVGEVMWVIDGSEFRPAQIKLRKQQRFTFMTDDKGHELRLLTLEHPFKGISLPERKFIRFSFDERYDNPYGFGLGHSLFWPIFFKRKGITFWLVFCDKYGSPTSVGKYPPNASSTERAALKAALEAIAQDAGIMVPEGMDVSLLEAAKSGIDTYEKLVRYMDEQISEVVLGETGTTNQSGNSGSRARDQVGNEVRLETAKADGDGLCECLNNTLVKWIIDLNMPGAPYPELWRDFSESEDLKQKAERDTSLAQTGVKFKKQYFMREYNLQEDDFDLSEAKATADPEQPASFAAPESSRGIDDILAILERRSGPALERLIEPLRKMIENAKSLEEIRDKLLELYGELDTEERGVLMENAAVLAELKGRVKVTDEQ